MKALENDQNTGIQGDNIPDRRRNIIGSPKLNMQLPLEAFANS